MQEKTTFAVVDKSGFFYGRSEVTRTPGILLPKQARYQLRYTPIFNCNFIKEQLALLALLRCPKSFSAWSAAIQQLMIRAACEDCREIFLPDASKNSQEALVAFKRFWKQDGGKSTGNIRVPAWISSCSDRCAIPASLLPPQAALRRRCPKERATNCATPRYSIDSGQWTVDSIPQTGRFVKSYALIPQGPRPVQASVSAGLRCPVHTAGRDGRKATDRGLRLPAAADRCTAGCRALRQTPRQIRGLLR